MPKLTDKQVGVLLFLGAIAFGANGSPQYLCQYKQGTIHGSPTPTLTWTSGAQVALTPKNDTQFTMVYKGHSYTADWKAIGKTLVWSDGDVWTCPSPTLTPTTAPINPCVTTAAAPAPAAAAAAAAVPAPAAATVIDKVGSLTEKWDPNFPEWLCWLIVGLCALTFLSVIAIKCFCCQDNGPKLEQWELQIHERDPTKDSPDSQPKSRDAYGNVIPTYTDSGFFATSVKRKFQIFA